ncbi:DUF6913 domain-containing protein [Xanthovirga aplysinae]|uniref:DUF6913 domain-containing protein n=1 Tax=Xanthovirga aplysinae TaxID=2529853 RepID=UPI0012BC7863|nr:hypothetical protein [Xanthovirga aplysinae]MTI30922.1 hypothetical protein [Xanthovirga aplysinae]
MIDIKQTAIRYRIKSAKKKKAERAYKKYEDTQKIGILFSSIDLDKHDKIKNLVKKLKKDGKTISILSFVDKGRENHGFDFDYYTKEDFSLFGKVISENVQKFIDEEFDLLYHIDLEENPWVTSLMAQSKAKCRVGRHSETFDSFYELMLAIKKEEVSELIDQMYYYTNNL